jgi:hypothetical protein
MAVTAREMLEKALHPALPRKRQLLPLERLEEDADQLELLVAHSDFSFTQQTPVAAGSMTVTLRYRYIVC